MTMNATPLQKDALTETYYDMQNLISTIAWKFYLRYGGDFEEWKAQANLSFVEGYNNHKRTKAKLSTWLCWGIRTNLLDYANSLYKQMPKTVPYPTAQEDRNYIKEIEDKGNPSFSPLELLDELQEDTKTIVLLIWNPTEELKNMKVKNGENPCHMKVALRKYLHDIGWTGRRIKEAFIEIAEVINEK